MMHYYIAVRCTLLFHCLFAVGLLEQFQKGPLRRHDYKMDDVVDIEMQCDLLVILSIICQYDVHRKVCTKDTFYRVDQKKTGLFFDSL